MSLAEECRDNREDLFILVHGLIECRKCVAGVGAVRSFRRIVIVTVPVVCTMLGSTMLFSGCDVVRQARPTG